MAVLTITLKAYICSDTLKMSCLLYVIMEFIKYVKLKQVVCTAAVQTNILLHQKAQISQASRGDALVKHQTLQTQLPRQLKPLKVTNNNTYSIFCIHFVVFPVYTKRSQDNENNKLATKVDYGTCMLCHTDQVFYYSPCVRITQ